MKDGINVNNSKIILINKPSGLTSYKLIKKVAKEYNFIKIGHAGTLDPLATGLMIAMTNKATKLSDLLMKKDKVYYVEMKLGFETDTLDLEGKIIKQKEVSKDLTIKKIDNVLKTFVGDIKQVPPKYSAIKINGKKLYDLARKNIDVEIKKRDVKIYSISDIKFDRDVIKFRTNVSSGTYIRSLVRDIAYKLDTVGTMTFLKRESIDKFICPDDIKILEVYEVIDLDKINISDEEYIKLKNGQVIKYQYKGDYKKLHVFKNNEYMGMCDVIYNNCGIINIKRSNFFD